MTAALLQEYIETFRDPLTGRMLKKHEQAGNPEYVVWMHMKGRCLNASHKQYLHYGGRGISVCDRWMRFENFFADMGQRPSPEYSLDRRDNELGYYKENCRWATRIEQNRNHRGNRRITHAGETLCVAEWAERLKVPQSVISTRLKRGWEFARIVNTPRRQYPDSINRHACT